MKAIIHKDGIIHIVIDEVVSVDGGNVFGVDASVKGTTADITVVDSVNEFKPGDAFNPADFTDKRGQLPLTPAQYDKQRLDDVVLAIADAYARGVL